MVPPEGPAATRFEGAAVERSLEALESAAGGSFAAEDFELPVVAGAETAVAVLGVTRRPWGIYAAMISALVVVAAASFALGVWWATPLPG